jgi:transcriptional regulator with XRE-family HTH domain
MNIKEVFGSNVRQLREAAGLRQNELADKLEMKPTQLSGTEAGRTGFNADTVKIFCDFFKCEPVELFKTDDVSQHTIDLILSKYDMTVADAELFKLLKHKLSMSVLAGFLTLNQTQIDAIKTMIGQNFLR